LGRSHICYIFAIAHFAQELFNAARSLPDTLPILYKRQPDKAFTIFTEPNTRRYGYICFIQ
jgi:hypothetical protein